MTKELNHSEFRGSNPNAGPQIPSLKPVPNRCQVRELKGCNQIERETERKTHISSLIMVKKTVLKVSITCEKCKKKLLKAVSSLEGKLQAPHLMHLLAFSFFFPPIQFENSFSSNAFWNLNVC